MQTHNYKATVSSERHIDRDRPSPRNSNYMLSSELRHKAAFECVLSCFKQYFPPFYSVFICVSFCMSFCLLYVSILCISVFLCILCTLSVCMSVCLSVSVFMGQVAWNKLCDVMWFPCHTPWCFFFKKKNLDLAIQWLQLHSVFSSINPRKSGPLWPIGCFSSEIWSSVTWNRYAGAQWYSDKMHQQSQQQLLKITPQK